MKIFIVNLLLILLLASCSNTPELETGEIKTFQIIKKVINQSNQEKIFVDAKKLLSRQQIDSANIPVLFVELPSGQNGTLTPYPGEGVGKTWLGADGATITLEQGIVKASRGMGDDIMGSSPPMLQWARIENSDPIYSREVKYITGNNKISERIFVCKIKKDNQKKIVTIWDVKFLTQRFDEMCNNDGFKINNVYYVDDRGIVRKSSQYHSETIGYIITERLDR